MATRPGISLAPRVTPGTLSPMASTLPTTRASRGAGEEPPVRRSLLNHPMGLYYLLIGATLALLGLGLLMVLSASSVLSIRLHGSAYTLAQRQLLFAGIGIVLMIVATRLSVRTWRRLAWPALIVALALLVAVLVVGVEVSGQRNWIDIVGPFRLQPSEFAKIALILWSAD
ncbi:MAG: putative lipid II flippase FtsW, partial [Actinobacteria bacterium]|nr:putative lipid II flippase FtsW [Actinomycetota bacterium]